MCSTRNILDIDQSNGTSTHCDHPQCSQSQFITVSLSSPSMRNGLKLSGTFDKYGDYWNSFVSNLEIADILKPSSKGAAGECLRNGLVANRVNMCHFGDLWLQKWNISCDFPKTAPFNGIVVPCRNQFLGP